MINDGVLRAFELKRGEARSADEQDAARDQLQRAWIAAFQQVNRVAAAVVSPADRAGVMRLLTDLGSAARIGAASMSKTMTWSVKYEDKPRTRVHDTQRLRAFA